MKNQNRHWRAGLTVCTGLVLLGLLSGCAWLPKSRVHSSSVSDAPMAKSDADNRSDMTTLVKASLTHHQTEAERQNAVAVSTIDGTTEKGNGLEQFGFGDMVYVYITLPELKSGNVDNGRIKKLAVNWFNAGGEQVTSKQRVPTYTKTPHHVWFWINSAQLGKGKVHVDVLADGKLAHQVRFEVIEVSRLKLPWYQRIFKKTENTTTGNGSNVAPNHDNSTTQQPWYRRWFGKPQSSAAVGSSAVQNSGK